MGIRALAVGFLLASGWLTLPASAVPDPSNLPVRMLLSMSGVPVQGKPGCGGILPGLRSVRLGDLLASRLQPFDSGENRVAGSCTVGGRCTVTVSHADGEDVSGAEFRFRVRRGVAIPASLSCITTP